MDRTANNQPSLLQEADELCTKNNFKEAAGKYEEFLQKQDNHLALVKLAECNFQLKDFEKARDQLIEAESKLSKAESTKESQDLMSRIQHNLIHIQQYSLKQNDELAPEKALSLTEKDSPLEKTIQEELNDLSLQEGSTTQDPKEHKKSASNGPTIDGVDQERLDEAREVAKLLEDMEKKVSSGSQWFIVNMGWINKWQKYTYFDRLTNEQSAIPTEERVHPGKIVNQDILHTLSPQAFMKVPTKGKEWQNVQLQPNLKEGQDFMLVDDSIWQIWSKKYGFDQEVKRFGIVINEDTQEAIVEIYLKPILLFPFPNQQLFKFSVPKTILVSRKDTIHDLQKKAMQGLNFYLYNDLKEKSTVLSHIRLWKSLTNNLADIWEWDKKFKNYTNIKVDALPLNIADERLKDVIEDINIADDDVIIVETKQNGQWKLQPLTAASEEESKAFQTEETAKPSSAPLENIISRDLNEILTAGSRRGVTGLQNLGNTCFMNSGLQCLSNTIELTKYFSFGYYKNDINKLNPLGMGGKLALAYAELNKDMWLESTGRTAPWDLKKVVGKRVSKFSGFGQQDSCELISYVLDLMHEDLNRVIKKPYIEIKDSEGRPDVEVSKEHWDAFLARNKSIIVDLMYGQLKSTVVCQTCSNVSITFDPFLTLSLPIARPFKVQVYYVPQDFFNEKGKKFTPTHVKVFQIALDKDSKIKDLKAKVAEVASEGKAPTNLVVANFDIKTKKIATRFKDEQSCQDIEQGREETLVFDMDPPPEEASQHMQVELIFMKMTGNGKHQSGSALNKVLPRLALYHKETTMMDIKKDILGKVKYIFGDEKNWEMNEKELNETITLHLVDNLPQVRESRYYGRKAQCEFCETKHDQADTCDIKVKGKSANTEEGSQEITLADIYEAMKHKRDIVLAVIFKQKSQAKLSLLEPKYDESHINDMKQKKKQTVSLDSCFKAFNREELLSGTDQWYCNKCKEQRDILKKLEIYKLPRILIIQLKRFQSKKSSSGQGGFFNLAYAQICSQEKVGDLVDFPIEGLDMSPFIQVDGSSGPIYYDLYAVSNHYGSLHGGHYTAYGFNTLAQKWYDFNDSSVSSVSNPNEVVSPGAYILFYRKRDQ